MESDLPKVKVENTPENSGCTFTSNSAILSSSPNWKECSHHGLHKQVIIQEVAVKNGYDFLNKLEQKLLMQSMHLRRAAKWIDRINTIKKSKRNCKILIGFLGCTGAGKSSLINAILELVDCLPADDEKACTAVCVEISFNDNDDPSAKFIAKIERISSNDWRLELEKLFIDISDQVSNKDGETGEFDLERDLRIKSAFQKLKCVYPYIKSLKDLSAYTVASLMEDASVNSILGKSTTIKSATLEDFSAAIKPYIDSSNSQEQGGRSFAQWPLVKVVHLYLKSNILKDGIVLVDLPGSMDTNSARGAIAETYQMNLSVTCVVAPTARAASDKPAQDLLGKVTQLRLQLDNQFNSDHLAFIVTKTDSSLSLDRYIKHHTNVHDSLSSVFEKEEELKTHYLEIEKKRDDIKKLEAKLQAEIDNNNRKIKKLVKTIKDMKAARGVIVNMKGKRKRDDTPTESQASPEEKDMIVELNQIKGENQDLNMKLGNARAKIYRAEKGIKEIESLLWSQESKKRAASIQNRNFISAQELRKDFKNAAHQIGQELGNKELQVFCVSALMFYDFLQDRPKNSGFPTKADTGIPALQNWLIESTLPTRNRNAISFLEDIVSLELSMKPWVEDSAVEFKVSQNERASMDKVFRSYITPLKENLINIGGSITQDSEKTVQSGLFRHMGKIQGAATEDAERIVRHWAQKPMHWATHRAINNNCGDWKSSKNIIYHWNDDLANNYLEKIVTNWTKAVHRKLPVLRGDYDKQTEEVIERFVQKVTFEALYICPQLSDAIGLWGESSLRTKGILHNNSRRIFEEFITEVATNAHKQVKPEVVDSWTPIYKACAEESGTGHFKKNVQTHVDHIKSNGKKMYQKSTKAVQLPFKKLWVMLPDEFAEGSSSALARITEDWDATMERHMFEGDKEGSEISEIEAKAQLQRDFAELVSHLGADWSKEIDFPAEEVEVEPEEPVFVPIDLDDDTQEAEDEDDFFFE